MIRLKQPKWPQMLPTGLIVNVATIGAVGRKLPAPGTWGSVLGLLYFTVFFWGLSTLGVLLISAVMCYLAVGFCGEAEIRMGKRDPGMVILDEIVAVPLCFLAWPWLLTWGNTVIQPWAVFVAGFCLFRVFDILKPFGISRLQNFPQGWGVVVDDVAAALATCASMHLIHLLYGIFS